MFKYADYVYEIYRQGSFTKAAKKLYISQPSISAMVKKAEQQTGFAIFIKGTAELTEEGAIYIAAIEEMKKVERDLKNRVENVRSLSFGNVIVSGAACISSFVLPKIIMDFSSRYPKIKIEVFESDSIILQEKLLSEEIDILIDYDFDEEVFDAFPIKEEKILLAVPKHNPMNERLGHKSLSHHDICSFRHTKDQTPFVELNDFSEEKFIFLKSGNNMRKMSSKLCSECGFIPQVVIEVDQLMTAYNMAMAGMGITFVTDTLVSASVKNDKLCFYRIKSDHSQRMLYIANKKKKYIQPAVAEFIKVAREQYDF